MHPVLAQFKVGGLDIAVHAYVTFLALAALVAVGLVVRATAELGVPRRAATFAFTAAMAAGLVGARWLAVALDPESFTGDLSRVIALEPRGFALYGGFVAAIGVIVGAARRWRVSAWRLADASIAPVALGLVLVRIGCFLNGCCAGIVTDLPWAVRFPYGSSAWGQQIVAGQTGILGLAGHVDPVHPTQLYEAGAVLVCAALALVVRRRGVPPGGAALVFATGFLSIRVLNQLLRPESTSALPAAALIALYAIVAAGAAVLLALRLAARRNGFGRPNFANSSGV